MDVHEHDFQRKPGTTLECSCGFLKWLLAKAVAEIPQAWVFEDVALFVVAPVSKLVHSLIEIGNETLAEAYLDLRLDASVVHSSAASTVWVDPAYVAGEYWPYWAVSEVVVDGWVRLWRIELDGLEPHIAGGAVRDVQGNLLAENDEERCTVCIGPVGDDSRRCERLALPLHGTHLVEGRYYMPTNAAEINAAISEPHGSDSGGI